MRSDIENAVKTILCSIGEDPEREGLLGTPERIGRMYDELCAGYSMDLNTIVHGAIFHEDCDSMILVKDIRFYSLCEHHMLPFFGTVHVAYIPDGRIIGLSKIPRIVEMYSRRLQIQERMTGQIADALEELLQPKGIAVSVSGQHMCAMMRGVKKESVMVTDKFTGCFRDDPELRKDFICRTSCPGPCPTCEE